MKDKKMSYNRVGVPVLVVIVLSTVIGLVGAQSLPSTTLSFMKAQMPGVPESLATQACNEGSLMIYAGTWTEAQQAQIKGFEKRFPCVKVNTYSAKTGARRQRWLSEEHAGRHIADIIQDTDPGTLDQQAKQGLLMKYTISNDSSYPHSIDMPGYWYPLRIAMVGIAWNTNLVTPAEAARLKSWKGITDPVWKGKAAVVDPTAGGVAYLPWYAWDQLYGDSFIKAVGANHPRVMSGTNPTSAALAAGDISVIFNASETGLLPLLAKGAPIQWALPSPGVGPTTGQAIPADAPHPAAAKLYQEYSFTLEGYTLWQKYGGAPTRIGYKDQRSVASKPWYHMPDKMFSYDPATATAAMAQITKLFKQDVASAGGGL